MVSDFTYLFIRRDPYDYSIRFYKIYNIALRKGHYFFFYLIAYTSGPYQSHFFIKYLLNY